MVADSFTATASVSNNSLTVDSDGNTVGSIGNKVTQAADGSYSILAYTDGLIQSIGGGVDGFVNGVKTFTLGALTTDTMVIQDNDTMFHDSQDGGDAIADANGQQTLVSALAMAQWV